MKRFLGSMLLMLGLVVVAVVLASLSSHPATAANNTPALPPIAVSISNTPNVNANITNASLPVTGNVSAAVTGTVNANITNATIPVSGTLSATLAPGASVTVANSSLTVTTPPGTAHVGQDVNNLVTLWAGYAPSANYPSSTCTTGLEQILPSGSPSQSCYAVPAECSSLLRMSCSPLIPRRVSAAPGTPVSFWTEGTITTLRKHMTAMVLSHYMTTSPRAWSLTIHPPSKSISRDNLFSST